MGGSIVDLIRKLRAKAASTTFPAEREALLAKAAELMLKHDLTEAMVEPEPPRPLAPRPQPPRVVVIITVSGPGLWGGGNMTNGSSNTSVIGGFTWNR